MKCFRFILVLWVCATAAACGSRVIRTDGAEPVYRLDDGSACTAPAGFADLVKTDAVRRVRSLFLSSASLAEVVAAISELPSGDQLDAAFYISCGEFVRGELSDDVFAHQREIYQALRLEHLERGVQNWREDPEGYDVAGKICHFIFNGDVPDRRNVTRLVPKQTTVDDCALFVHANGGTHVRLGCSEGRWKTRWALQPLRVGPAGWINRRQSPAGTRYVPEPDCGWS